MAYQCALCPQLPPAETIIKFVGHLAGKHRLNTSAYVLQFPESAPWFAGLKTVQDRRVKKHLKDIQKFEQTKKEKPHRPELQKPDNDRTTSEQILAHLSEAERLEYQAYYDQVFQQVDRDPTQSPIIESLALDIVSLKKLRLDQLSAKEFSKSRSDEIKEVSGRINTYLGLLGISRDQKLKNKTQVKSSVGMLIGGYLDEIERKSKEELQTMDTEEKQALHAVSQRIADWILSPAPDLTQDELLETDGSPNIPDISEIARRANISL